MRSWTSSFWISRARAVAALAVGAFLTLGATVAWPQQPPAREPHRVVCVNCGDPETAGLARAAREWRIAFKAALGYERAARQCPPLDERDAAAMACQRKAVDAALAASRAPR